MNEDSFTEDSWADYLYWQNQDKKILIRINKLIKEIFRNPFDGIGKPEKLKHVPADYYSRRITGEHRIVYKSGMISYISFSFVITIRDSE